MPRLAAALLVLIGLVAQPLHAADISIALSADVTSMDPYVLNAAPNGYMLLASAFNHIILNHAVKGVTFDPQADFETIGRTARAPLLMVLAPNRPEKARGQTAWPFPATALVNRAQELNRAQCRGGQRNGVELEGSKEQRSKAMQYRPGTRGKR